MESAILLLIAIGACFYIYKSLTKNSGCNCGNDKCPISKKDK